MAKGQKRQQPSDAATAKKAKVVADPNIKGVQDALRMGVDLPESCRDMLLACIPEALGVPVDQRREAQDLIVKMIGEVLDGVKASLQQAVEAEAAKLEQLESTKGDLDAQVTSCEAGLASAREAAQQRSTELAGAATALGEAKAQLQAKEAENANSDREFAEASQKLIAIDDAISSHFRPLAEGVDGSEAHFASLAPFLEEAAVDESLLQALPSTCSKPFSERSSFDAMAVQQLGKSFEERAASLRQIVQTGEPAAQARAAAAAEAKAAVEAATAAQAKRDEELLAAQQAEKDAAAALEAAKEAVQSREPAMELARQARDQKAEALEQFSVYNIGCFQILRDAQTPKAVEVDDALSAVGIEAAAAGAGA